MLDNLLDNAKKAGARTCTIDLKGNSKVLEIFITDNGKGLNKKFKKPKNNS